MAGLVLAVAGGALLVALVSYNPADPSFPPRPSGR
ncbi:DNA translocase FtsK 4TM domain-containing protein [Pseudoroseomonas wenyumeiae]